MNRHLLVLDLDETLIHANTKPLSHAPDHSVGPYFVYERPGLEEFLKAVAVDYELAVWTSSSPAYAHAICSHLFPDPSSLSFVWASDRCTPTRNFELGERSGLDTWVLSKRIKKLRRRGYDLDRVIVVDDSPEKHEKNYGNLVPIVAFYGDPNDSELSKLAKYLNSLTKYPNLRAIEKRYWRTRWLG